MPLRGQLMIFDSSIGELFDLSTGRVNEIFKRNSELFPEGSWVRLTKSEVEGVIAECDNPISLSFTNHLPRAFAPAGFQDFAFLN